MDFNKLEDNSILRQTPLTDESVDIANKIMKNIFYLSGALEEVDFNEGIQWEYTHKNNMNTYLLYLHSLTVTSYLINAYEILEDIKYLKKAYEIIESWIKYEENYKKNDMIWYDHTTASRTHNFIYFYIIAKDVIKLDENKYEDMIMKHIHYLYDDANYLKNNHGIMMDKALITCSNIITHDLSPNWAVKGLSRLKETFYNSYSNQGVHLENSIYYHNFVYKLYIQIEEFLNKNQLSLGKEILEMFPKIGEYFKYAAKPNCHLPLLGDTSRLIAKKIEKKYEPFIDYDAGVAYLQYKNKSNLINSTWLSFICGYFKKTHKHFDDLSFTLFYKGQDIFIDSGSFGYGRGKERRYVQSPMSHNIFMANNKHYKLLDGREAYYKIRITDFLHNDSYSIVKGKNCAYEGIKLERTIIVFNPDIVIIYDKGISEVENKYTQIFNIAPEFNVTKLTSQICEMKNENLNVEIIQYNEVNSSEYFKADREIPRAVISETTGKLTDISQVEFNKIGKKESFLTLISLDNSKKRIGSFVFDANKNKLDIEVDNENYKFIL